MSNQTHIPEVSYSNLHEKPFEFQFVTNKEVLMEVPSKAIDPFRPHRISFYSILFIIEGEGKHFIDFKTYKYKKGSIIFIAKDQVHAFERNESRNARFMGFTEEFFQKSRLGSTLIKQLGLFNYQLNSPLIQLNEGRFKVFENLVNRLEQEYHSPDDSLTEEIILSLLRIFLCLAERERNNKIADRPQIRFEDEFLIFQNLVQKHLFESRKVKFYASLMNISPKQLNRITQEVTGLPTKEYLNDVLVMEIKRFLMNTSLSVKEIGYKTGFEEDTNFVKYFKKYAGMTPARFRYEF